MTEDQQIDRIVEPARSPEEVRRVHASNRAAWNEGAARYTENIAATITFIREGQSNVHRLEREMLGDLAAYETAVHLQCASGRDTLSLWVEGVRHVVGVDISDVMIENARRTAAALDAPARWFCCDVIDTPGELDATADLVYTGRGALNWMHDIGAWAAVIARLLKPGGVASIFDTHPASWLFEEDASELRVMKGVNYFGIAWESQGWPSTYIGELEQPASRQSVKADRLWTLADVFGALTGAGLVVEHLGEHPDAYWDAFPNLDAESRARIPQTFTMRARRPRG